jgi:serine/threonine protein kinase
VALARATRAACYTGCVAVTGTFRSWPLRSATRLPTQDVKPANLLIGRDGRLKLADFGSACLISTAMPDASGTTRHARSLAPREVYRLLTMIAAGGIARRNFCTARGNTGAAWTSGPRDAFWRNCLVARPCFPGKPTSTSLSRHALAFARVHAPQKSPGCSALAQRRCKRRLARRPQTSEHGCSNILAMALWRCHVRCAAYRSLRPCLTPTQMQWS